MGYEELCGLLREILPLDHGHAGFEGSGREGFGEEGSVSDALVAAFLICQRMNKETARELKAYNLALDDDVGEEFLAFLFFEVVILGRQSFGEKGMASAFPTATFVCQR